MQFHRSISWTLLAGAALLLPAWTRAQKPDESAKPYLHGEARVTYRGKRYVFPINPAARQTPGIFIKSGSPLRRLILDYSISDGSRLYFNAAGIGASGGAPQSMTIYFYLEGKSVDLFPFTGCELKVDTAEPDRAHVTVECTPSPTGSGLERVELSATP